MVNTQKLSDDTISRTIYFENSMHACIWHQSSSFTVCQRSECIRAILPIYPRIYHKIQTELNWTSLRHLLSCCFLQQLFTHPTSNCSFEFFRFGLILVQVLIENKGYFLFSVLVPFDFLNFSASHRHWFDRKRRD